MKTKAIVIMMFVVAGFVVPSLADFDTVGLYDPDDGPHNNQVDQSGTFDSGTGGADIDNVLFVADFMPGGAWDPNVDFMVDMGGVVDFEGTNDLVLVGLNQVIYAIYGTSDTKTVYIEGTDGTLSIADGESNGREPISGNYRLNNSNNDFDFNIGVTVGDDYERVVVFGGTVLTRSNESVQPVVTATFSDGSTVTSKASMIGAPNKDSFFGFVAPAGAYIVSVNFNLSGSTSMDDLVFITEIMKATIDAGPDQTVELYDVMAGNGNVVMDANVVIPHQGEGYTYAWTSDPAGGVAFSNAADEDPTVTFTTGGVYTLTVHLTGTAGADSYDDVIITVVMPTVDAGPDQTSASGETVELDSTIINPYLTSDPNEVYTYLWSGDWDSITDETEADPNAIFTGAGTHVMTLEVFGDVYGPLGFVPLATDTVDIFIVADANWVGATEGDWHDAENWDPNVLPDTALTALLGNKSAENDLDLTVVEVDAAVSVYNIELANDPNYPYTLNVNGGVAVETVGDLNIASQEDVIGIVNVLGASTITIGDDLIIGDDGDGTFSALAGSTVDIGDELQVGDNGQGTFTMTGGSLDVGGDIDVSKDDNNGVPGNGKGTMTLDNVAVNCGDDFKVASDSDDGDGSGVGIVTILNGTEIVIGDNLLIGERGTGTFTATDSSIEVNGEVEVGRRSTGTLILNNTDLTTDDQGELRVGVNSGGDGAVIMTNGSTIETDDHIAIGGGYKGDGNPGGNGVGTLTMTDSDIEMSSSSLRDFIVCRKAGTGTLTMHGESTILVDDDFDVAFRDTAVGIVVMDGNSFINVDDHASFGGGLYEDDQINGWGTGDDTKCRLTMSDTATIHIDGKFFFAMMPDTDKWGSSNRNELRMSGDTQINVKQSDSNLWIAKYAGSYAYVEIDGGGTRPKIICDELRIAENGGGCDFDIEDGTIDIRKHFKVAHSVDPESPVAPAPVNIVIHNGATIDIGYGTGDGDIKIGGLGAMVTIELIDGTIDSSDGGGQFRMPHSGPSGVGGYAQIILGVDANDLGNHDPGDAEIKLDGILDADYAGENDFIDFLGAGRLTMQQNKIDPNDIDDHIISGYFRTSYGTVGAWTDLDGVVPGAGEVFRVVYTAIPGDTPKYRIELGIASPCVASPAGDLDGDCDVDIADLAILLDDWLNTATLDDFAELAANFGKCGKAYGYSCD